MKKKAICICLVCSFFLPSFGLAGIEPIANKNYVLYVKESDIFFLEIQSGEVKKISMPSKVVKVEMCASVPLVEVVIEETNIAKYTNWLVDISKVEKHKIPPLPEKSKRWSVDGKYACINMQDRLFFVLPKNLVEFLKYGNQSYIYSEEIYGHVMGLIWVEHWLNDYVIYGTGSGGEDEWYGVYDLKRKKNYFLKYYRIDVENMMINNMENPLVATPPVEVFFEKMKTGKMVPSSKDNWPFFKDTLKKK